MDRNTRAVSPWQSPVAIPEELLLQIFTHLVDEVMLPKLPFRHLDILPKPGPLIISQVCRLWRKVAAQHVPFWCNVDFGNKNIALLYLSRTNLDTPLHVRFTGAGGPAERIDQCQCVQQRVENINSLIVEPRDDVDIYPVLQFLVKNPPLYNLKTLHVGDGQKKYLDGEIDPVRRDNSQRQHFPHLTVDFLNLLGRTESLRSVEDLLLDSIEIPLRSPAYDNLVHLDLFDFKPQISPIELLEALRRSPRLETLNLTAVLADLSPSEVVVQSEVELLELYELNVVSGSFRSTFYLLAQIYAPELYNLGVEVSSDGSTFGLDQLLSTREDSLMFDRIETVMLSQISDGTGVSLSGYAHSDELEEVICRIRVYNCTWESQYGRPIFSEHLSSAVRVELLDDTCNVVKLLDGHPVQELMLGGQALVRFLKHLRPGCRLEDVMRLELNCSSIGKTRSAESYLEWLRMSEQLQLLRLYGYASLAREDVERFNRYGLQSGVEVEWAGQDTLEPLMLPYPMPKFIDSASGQETDETLLCIKRKQDEDGFDVNIKRQKRFSCPTENAEYGFPMESVEIEEYPQTAELCAPNQDGMELD